MYKPGDWNAICDKCGMKRKASELRLNWQNLFVCASTCWEPRHPQDFVKGVPDDQTVSISRPWVAQTMGTTTVSTTALRYAFTIVLASVTGIADGDSLGIVLDDGSVHWTFSNGDPSGTTVTLGSELPGKATSGNTVYVPGVNKEAYVTCTSVLASEL